jgi:hypothetical protein
MVFTCAMDTCVYMVFTCAMGYLCVHGIVVFEACLKSVDIRFKGCLKRSLYHRIRSKLSLCSLCCPVLVT